MVAGAYLFYLFLSGNNLPEDAVSLWNLGMLDVFGSVMYGNGLEYTSIKLLSTI